MNNKGQSLVLFILIIPILLSFTALVIDVGRAVSEKSSLNNKIELIIECGLEDNLTNDEVNELTEHNLSDYDYEVNINDNVIEINASTYVEGIFSNILDFKGFNIESEYRGFMADEKMIIEKVK